MVFCRELDNDYPLGFPSPEGSDFLPADMVATTVFCNNGGNLIYVLSIFLTIFYFGIDNHVHRHTNPFLCDRGIKISLEGLYGYLPVIAFHRILQKVGG